MPANDRSVTIANNATGVRIDGGASFNNIAGNFIGTNSAGDAGIPNSGDGVLVQDSGSNAIGGVAGQGNVISGGNFNGIDILGGGSTNTRVQGNFVGTDATIAAGVAAVRPGGAFGLIGSAGGRLHKPWFGALPRDGEVYTFQGGTVADAQEVIALAGAGLVRNDVEEFPFAKADDAYARLAAGTLSGRAVVVLDS